MSSLSGKSEERSATCIPSWRRALSRSAASKDKETARASSSSPLSRDAFSPSPPFRPFVIPSTSLFEASIAARIISSSISLL
uniref:Uncharacterized protein n=1 Tax=Arundo donax TaxID=35708 RepID=A0A0A9EVC4_ARUDO